MKVQAIMDHYNYLLAQAAPLTPIRSHQIGAVPKGLVISVEEYTHEPADRPDVAAAIAEAIARHYPAALDSELRAAAAESREAVGWRGTTQDNWLRNGVGRENLAGIRAVQSAQDEILQIIRDSDRRRREAYEIYRRHVEQGTALPPMAATQTRE